MKNAIERMQTRARRRSLVTPRLLNLLLADWDAMTEAEKAELTTSVRRCK